MVVFVTWHFFARGVRGSKTKPIHPQPFQLSQIENSDMARNTADLVAQLDVANHFPYDSLIRYCSSNISGFPQPPTQFTVSQVFVFFGTSLVLLGHLGFHQNLIFIFILAVWSSGEMLF